MAMTAAQRRAASISQRTPKQISELDRFAWKELLLLARDRGAATGVEWAIDHMIPLAATKASGLHSCANWQVIPKTLNSSKANRLVLTEPDEWIAYLDDFGNLTVDMQLAKFVMCGVPLAQMFGEQIPKTPLLAKLARADLVRPCHG